MDLNMSTLWLVLGIGCIVFGAVLLVEFIKEFAQLIFGLGLVMIGLVLMGFSRQPRARVKVR